MAEEVTIARPYAEAVNRLAAQTDGYGRWSEALAFAAAVVRDPQMNSLIDNPNVTDAQVADAFFAVCGERLGAEGRNLVAALLENGRLPLLPVVAELFEQLKAVHDGKQEAVIHSAYPLNDADVADLKAKLAARFGRQVDAQVEIDPELIGGVKIVLGDVVIDASIRARLQDMAYRLKS